MYFINETNCGELFYQLLYTIIKQDKQTKTGRHGRQTTRFDIDKRKQRWLMGRNWFYQLLDTVLLYWLYFSKQQTCVYFNVYYYYSGFLQVMKNLENLENNLENLENLEKRSYFGKVMEKVMENLKNGKKSWKRSWKIFFSLQRKCCHHFAKLIMFLPFSPSTA